MSGRLSLEELLLDGGDAEGVEWFKKSKLKQLEQARTVSKVNGNTKNCKEWKGGRSWEKNHPRKRVAGRLPNGFEGTEELKETYIKFDPELNPETVRKIDETIKGFQDYRKANGLL